MSALRPLALGELIDRSAATWRAHWKPLFQLALGFQLVQYLVLKLWQLGLARWAPAALNAKLMAEQLKQDPGAVALQMFLGFGAIGLVTLFFTQVAGVAEGAFIYPRLTGTGQPGIGAALRTAARRLRVATGALGFGLGWTVVVALLFQLPAVALAVAAFFATRSSDGAGLVLGGLAAIAAGLALVVTVVWFVVRFFCMPQVVAIEDGGAWRAFRRADALSSGRVEPGVLGLTKVRLAILITVVALILGILAAVSAIPSGILQVVYGHALDPVNADASAIPASLLVPAELAQIVVTSLFAPVYAVFQVLFYVDMRVRREGLDLALQLAPRSEGTAA